MKPSPAVLIFATMRRSGSHFCMHRALASVKQGSVRTFGAHINSIGWGKFNRKTPIDNVKILCERKQNHYYTYEQVAAPRTGSDAVGHQCQKALRAILRGCRDQLENPSGLSASFVAVNIEDTPCDLVREQARSMLAGTVLEAAATNAPVFVVLRSLRSIAVSRKKWLEKNGDRNIMAGGFRRLDIGVWEDHFSAAEKGKTAGGAPAIALHYKQAVETHGESARNAIISANERFGLGLAFFPSVPPWVRESVLSDGQGSSFVGSGKTRGAEVVRSLNDRGHLLEEAAWVFEKSKEASRHASQYGEL